MGAGGNGNNFSWEREGMGIKMKLDPGIGNENGNESVGMEGNGTEKVIPPYLYLIVSTCRCKH